MCIAKWVQETCSVRCDGIIGSADSNTLLEHRACSMCHGHVCIAGQGKEQHRAHQPGAIVNCVAVRVDKLDQLEPAQTWKGAKA